MSGEQILRVPWRPGPPGRVVYPAVAEPDSTHPMVRFQLGGWQTSTRVDTCSKRIALLRKFSPKEDQL